MLYITEGQFDGEDFFSFWSSLTTLVPAAQSLLCLESLRIAPCSGRHIKGPFGWRFSLLRCVFHLLSGSFLLATTPWSMSRRIGHDIPRSASVRDSMHSYLIFQTCHRWFWWHVGNSFCCHCPSYHTAFFHFPRPHPPFIFFFLVAHLRLSSPTLSLVCFCNCLGSRLLSELKYHLTVRSVPPSVHNRFSILYRQIQILSSFNRQMIIHSWYLPHTCRVSNLQMRGNYIHFMSILCWQSCVRMFCCKSFVRWGCVCSTVAICAHKKL